jgi:hypothetical protein
MGAYPPHARKKKADNLEKVYATFPVLKENRVSWRRFFRAVSGKCSPLPAPSWPIQS